MRSGEVRSKVKNNREDIVSIYANIEDERLTNYIVGVE